MAQIPSQLEAWQAETRSMEAGELLAWTWRRFGDQAVFATSLGAEDQALADLIHRISPGLPAFMLDTGRLFPETYDLLARTERKYRLGIKVFFPDAQEVEAWVLANGINGFRESVQQRKDCCAIRKTQPLGRALAGHQAWVTGLRRDQSPARAEVQPVEWDATWGLIKVNPLASWTDEQLWGFLKAQGVPYSPLHDQGYPSIGCAPCTRAVKIGEDPRAGRWWWEQDGHKECGLHRPR